MSLGTKAGALALLLFFAGAVGVTLGFEWPGTILVFAAVFVLVVRLFLPGGSTSPDDSFDLGD